ncbi:MAG: SUMF1/EgtB/PvdO family nonheme iron enzyme [Phycisphaerales bacterium]
MACLAAGAVLAGRRRGRYWLRLGQQHMDAGNRGTHADGAVPYRPNYYTGIGSVDHEYRIMRTKVTSEQWVEFVNAYVPYWNGSSRDSQLTGSYVGPSGDTYIPSPGAEQWAVRPAFYMAARYCNWLHNGKVNEEWAFESGAYDMSRLVFADDGRTILSDTLERSPGAKYWIPSLDEWVKAVYWDPNKDGVGGYWQQPDGGDDPLIAGLPGAGETLGDATTDEIYNVPVGSYPDTRSPWGLLDVSGHWWESIDTPVNPNVLGERYLGGSAAGSATYWLSDRIDFWLSGDAKQLGSIRLASAVPAPGTAAPLLALIAWRRRR